MRNLKINSDRLWSSLMEMAEIGATDKGGCCRLALTDLDREGRDLFVRWCEEAGCTIAYDDMGNIFARRPGRDPERAPVACGSHLDTQPTGGKFDGVYGVLAGLEVIRSLNDLEIETDAPIEVSVWTNEEGARFAPSMIGSGVFAGTYTTDYAHQLTDLDGLKLGDELQRIGYLGEEKCGDRTFGAFFEAHIEQGPILENEGKTIGVVTGGQGLCWYDITVTGQESHAGTTPMPARRDGMMTAARIVLAVEEIARKYGPEGVGTVGQMVVSPNSRNTIPGTVEFSVDIRHPDPVKLEGMHAELLAAVDAERMKENCEIAIERIANEVPMAFDKACVDAVRDAASACGLAHRDIVSGAGHDACFLSHIVPVGMIFVPCEDGISHNEVESATPEDLAAGCEVLMRAMLSRAMDQA